MIYIREKRTFHRTLFLFNLLQGITVTGGGSWSSYIGFEGNKSSSFSDQESVYTLIPEDGLVSKIPYRQNKIGPKRNTDQGKCGGS